MNATLNLGDPSSPSTPPKPRFKVRFGRLWHLVLRTKRPFVALRLWLATLLVGKHSLVVNVEYNSYLKAISIMDPKQIALYVGVHFSSKDELIIDTPTYFFDGPPPQSALVEEFTV